MGTKEYLDKSGLAILWSRIQQLIYECGGGGGNRVTYHIEGHVVNNGAEIWLVGSDGSKSTVRLSDIEGDIQ